jgi:site-specific recombinase XerD
MIDPFKKYLFQEMKHKQTKTIRSYIRAADEFLLFVKKEGISVSMLREVHVRKWNNTLREKGASNHTIAWKNSALRRFFKHLRQTGVMVQNPMEEIQQPSLEKRKEEVPTNFLSLIEEMVVYKRDKLLFYFLMLDKIKPSELVGLKLKNIEQKQGVLFLEQRAISIHEKTKKMCSELEGDRDAYLFTNQFAKPLTQAGVYFVVKTHLKRLGYAHLRPIDLLKF